MCCHDLWNHYSIIVTVTSRRHGLPQPPPKCFRALHRHSCLCSSHRKILFRKREWESRKTHTELCLVEVQSLSIRGYFMLVCSSDPDPGNLCKSSAVVKAVKHFVVARKRECQWEANAGACWVSVPVGGGSVSYQRWVCKTSRGIPSWGNEGKWQFQPRSGVGTRDVQWVRRPAQWPGSNCGDIITQPLSHLPLMITCPW